MIMDNAALRGKCVVVTGASGYIGQVLAHRITEAGCRLRLVSRGVSAQAVHADVEWITADLSRENDWRQVIDGADAVMHLSWRTELAAAESDPAGDEQHHHHAEYLVHDWQLLFRGSQTPSVRRPAAGRPRGCR